MGFCTTINPRTGREVLVCDFCGGYPARKIRCPFNYCQAWATCANCKTEGKHKQSSNGGNPNHAQCKIDHQEFEARQLERKEQADRVTVAAWGDWCTGQTGIVLVVTGSGDYYLVPSKHYQKRDVMANNFIDENYKPIATDQAKALLAVQYGDMYGLPTSKEVSLA